MRAEAKRKEKRETQFWAQVGIFFWNLFREALTVSEAGCSPGVMQPTYLRMVPFSAPSFLADKGREEDGVIK